MPIGYFRDAPKIDIRFDDRLYLPGEELHVTVVMHTERPGLKVRSATVDLVLEHRYTEQRQVQVVESRNRAGSGLTHRYGRMQIGDMNGAYQLSPPRIETITEQHIDRTVQARKELISDGSLRRRTEMFGAELVILRPSVRRRGSQVSYQLVFHMDLPRMRDVEMHRIVRVS